MLTDDQRRRLRASVVKVFDGGRRVIGTGFLVRRDLVATCAHVVEKALKNSPENAVLIRFFNQPEDIFSETTPAAQYAKQGVDVAFLRLREPVPDGIQPLLLAPSGNRARQGLEGYGYPEGKPSGRQTNAVILGPDDPGRLLLRSTDIVPGCSGGPLWDIHGDVVGMAGSIDEYDSQTGRGADIAYATISELLTEICPELTFDPRGQTARCNTGPAPLNHLEWQVVRETSSFRAYVVEPDAYNPKKHANVFRAVLSRFGQSSFEKTELKPVPPHMQAPLEPFDLLTFPEAFLLSSDLVDSLSALAASPQLFGCVHTGLRATDGDRHLFRPEDLCELMDRILSVPRVVSDDLKLVRQWLNEPGRGRGMYNVGCMFALDAKDRVRVCLHLKNVRSRDTSPPSDRDMSEARFFSLVSLRPLDRQMSSIVIQPLICSDVLEDNIDTPEAHPLSMLTQGARALDRFPPDHVDIVSVAAYSRQFLERQGAPGQPHWKHKFLGSYERAARSPNWRRHRYAVFVVSNFRVLPVAQMAKASRAVCQAGLSGAFVPTPVDGFAHGGARVLNAVYARIESAEGIDERWMTPEGCDDKGGRVLGHIMATDSSESPVGANPLATVLGFTIAHLPRDGNRWGHDGEFRRVEQVVITGET